MSERVPTPAAPPIKLSSPETKEFWEIPVVFEDEHLLGISKPARLLTSPDRYDPNRPNLIKLLHTGVAQGKPWARARGLTYLSNAHRLDFETTGVLLLAKNKPALVQLANLFGSEWGPSANDRRHVISALLYVYPLQDLTVGASCDRCGAPLSGSPIVKTLSDEHGHFVLENVPAGTDIPIVVQLGKWRRVTTIPMVAPCQENVLTDKDLTRLPRKRSEGDMPKIAVTLGACDQISCMLPKVGIDSSEFGVAGQDRAVTFYSTPSQSGLAGATSATGRGASTCAAALTPSPAPAGR